MLGTAAPFLLGLVVGWIVVGLIARRTHDRYGTWLDVDGGFDIWLATVIVGLAARRLLWDRGIALAFVIVAAVVLGVACSMGWRVDRATCSQRTSALISHPATLSTPPQQGGHDDGGTVINLYVGNLPYTTTSDELATLFGRVGAVTSAQVIMDRETNRSRGFGFVEMADEDARKAIDELTGADMGGRAITVNEARPRAPAARCATTTVATERRRQFVMAPVSAPCTRRRVLRRAHRVRSAVGVGRPALAPTCELLGVVDQQVE